MAPQRLASASRADLHVHSTASELSKLGVQRAVGLPECATPPEEVYALAKARGMDWVTITDHDTIAGALELQASHPDDVFLSEELTAWFKGEPQAVHVLCYGITEADHEWLQAHRTDVERVAEYLHEREITCALAHPFYAVEAPLTARHRRRLAELFPIWEVRNGSRARELNMPAAIYVDTHGGIGIGGTDDHAGVDIGRTFTETPRCGSWREYLAHIRAGACRARGDQGSAAKWAHSALALAWRSLGRPEADAVQPVNPVKLMDMVGRLMSEGDQRSGEEGEGLGPDDARALLFAWLQSMGLDAAGTDLIALMQAEGFQHGDLQRRAKRVHEKRLADAVAHVVEETSKPEPNYLGAAFGLFYACIPAVPYAPAAAFLGAEKAKLITREHEPVRVALVADAIGGMHGVTHTLDELRDRGVPGFDVEVIGTDANVDRRLPAVAEVDIPHYAGLKVGVPSLPAVVEAIAEGRYGAVHLCSPGPAGLLAAITAKVMGLPILGSYHTELSAYAGLRTGSDGLEQVVHGALGAFYGLAHAVLSPSAVSDESLVTMGVDRDKIGRWDRGVDVERFDPAKRREARFAAPDGTPRLNVLYVGRQTKEKGVDLLAEAFLAARARDERLHLVLAGGGPEREALEERLGEHATFLGWQEGEELATTFASADLFLFASQTDTFGQVLLEAQASGLPVVAVGVGGPVELVEDGRTGVLREPDAHALADALVALAASPALRDELSDAALAAVQQRTWDAALRRLAEGYHRAIAAVEVAHATPAGIAAAASEQDLLGV